MCGKRGSVAAVVWEIDDTICDRGPRGRNQEVRKERERRRREERENKGIREAKTREATVSRGENKRSDRYDPAIQTKEKKRKPNQQTLGQNLYCKRKEKEREKEMKGQRGGG